jgi:DNA-binding CsgD family transcriptional regulator
MNRHQPTQSVSAEGDPLDELLFDLHSALDIESFWRANLRLLKHAMPYHSCSLMLGIVDAQPNLARHNVVADPHPGYLPASSLSVASDYLARHSQVKLYTFSQVVAEDPKARQRRLEQERAHVGTWNEFVHLAFWKGVQPDAVLSVRRGPEHGAFQTGELTFLERLHPVIDAGLHRLRALEHERARNNGIERFLAGLPMPVLFLDFDLQLLFASREGYEACATWNMGAKASRVMNTRRVFKLPPEIAIACERLGGECDRTDDVSGVVAVSGIRVPHPGNPGLVARVALSQPVRGPWVRPGFFVTFTQEKNSDGASLPMPRSAMDHLGPLSPSERRVALLVADGCSNREIATRLGKSERTVECQLNTVYRKLGGANRVQLVRLLK